MAAQARVTVLVEIDNQPVRGFPLVRSLALDELAVAGPVEYATGAGFVSLNGVSDLTTQQLLIFEADQALTMRFASGAAGDLSLAANSLVIIANMGQTAATQISNASGSTAIVKSQLGGT